MADNTGFIVAAYTVTWVVLLAYAIRLHRLSRRAREQFTDAARYPTGAEHE